MREAIQNKVNQFNFDRHLDYEDHQAMNEIGGIVSTLK